MSEAETRAKKDVVDSERPRPESGRATGLEEVSATLILSNENETDKKVSRSVNRIKRCLKKEEKLLKYKMFRKKICPFQKHETIKSCSKMYLKD